MFFVRNEAPKESGMRSTVWIGRFSYQLNPGETIKIPEDYLMADLRRFLNKTKNVLGHIKVYTLDEYNEKYVHPSLNNDQTKKIDRSNIFVEKDMVNIEEKIKVDEEVKVDVDDEDAVVKEESTASDKDMSFRNKLNKKKKN